MTIWILAVLLMASVALAGWRQGAIRAAFSFVGILFAALLAAPVGRMLHPLLPHLGFSSPITAWALAPVSGFIVAIIPWKIAAHYVHQRVEHFYKYRAGELREALWLRLNSRLGICVGVMNGAAYFVLLSFFIFNLTYWTTQLTANATEQPMAVRLVNSLGDGLQGTGFSKTAAAVGTVNPTYYRLGDLAGLLMQNPQLGPRFAQYPGLASLWQRDDMQSLVNDPLVTNALASGTSVGEFAKIPSVQEFIKNKELSKQVTSIVTSNLADINDYLRNGKSKYDAEKAIGNWNFNAGVTLAWLRQDQPRMGKNEMAAIRMLWSQAYAQTTILMTGDNQAFIRNFPKFIAQAPQGQLPFQLENWKGDWSRDGNTYTVHVAQNGEDKYLTATVEGPRLRLKEGRNTLIFDRAD
ncbi:MAG TPA: CvpA family protein [Verrucomicrobiae bacterium]